MKKTFLAFSMPITSAVRDTMVMKGYMICASHTPSATLLSSFQPSVSSGKISGASAVPAAATIVMKQSERDIIFRPKAHAASSPSILIFFENVVTKAVESAPSAKRSRSMFGVRKAMVKIPANFIPNTPPST